MKICVTSISLLNDWIATKTRENRKRDKARFYMTKPVRWFSLSKINKCYASSDVQLQISLKSPPDISKYDTGEK